MPTIRCWPVGDDDDDDDVDQTDRYILPTAVQHVLLYICKYIRYMQHAGSCGPVEGGQVGQVIMLDRLNWLVVLSLDRTASRTNIVVHLVVQISRYHEIIFVHRAGEIFTVSFCLRPALHRLLNILIFE